MLTLIAAHTQPRACKSAPPSHAQIEQPLTSPQPYLDSDMQSRWWDFGGDTIIRTDQYIRLSSDKPSRDGWLFSRVPLTATNWEVRRSPHPQLGQQLTRVDHCRIQGPRPGQPLRRWLCHVAHQAARPAGACLWPRRQVRGPRSLRRHVQEQPPGHRVPLHHGHERRRQHAL